MIVMPSNNARSIVHYWAGVYPGRLGHLYSPGGWMKPYPWLPYALDCGVFGPWSRGEAWDAEGFKALLRLASASIEPVWVAVPDAVGERERTIEMWDEWHPVVSAYGSWPLAFVVQDGMDERDVPTSAAVVFVGGSTKWKLDTLATWCALFPRVHVGRVNTYERLRLCHDAGAESCDGTGWMRGDPKQLHGLERYLRETKDTPGRVFALPDDLSMRMHNKTLSRSRLERDAYINLLT